MTRKNQSVQADRPRIRQAHLGEPCGDAGPQGGAPTGPCPAEPGVSSLPIVAEHGGRVVAGVRLTLAEDHTALVHNLWIDPAWSESDLLLRMMVAALEHGSRLGCLKVDMEPDLRGLTVFAMLLDSGLLMDRSRGDGADEAAGEARCYLNLYKNAASVLA